MARLAILPLALLTLLTVAGCGGTTNGSGGSQSSAKPAPTITTSSLPRATRGAAYNTQLLATTPAGSEPVVWSLATASSALPAGLALAGDGTLSGTPGASGLFEMVFECANQAGGKTDIALDLVVYEPAGYVHAPDVYDTPANDSFATATNMGALSMANPIVQTTPLSVTSDPVDPNTDPVDYFSFSTADKGRIQIEVFFDYRSGGKLFAFLGGEHNGNPEDEVSGMSIANGDDSIMVMDAAAPGTWYLRVEAQYKNGGWNANGYTFRITFNDITITTGLVEYDVASAGGMNAQLQADVAGIPVSAGNWSQISGTLPAGVTLAASGTLGGTPTQLGLFDAEMDVQFNGYTTSRAVRIRIYDSGAGDYWQRFGQHRYYDAARTNGDGEYHQHYCEAMVVAPHPAYGAEGAIYVIGGRVSETVNNVYVFHTAHQSNTNLEYKLEDIGRPLGNERQYLGAAFIQHTYGGYIYVVGGELYSNTAPSSGDFTRVVERMQVADGSGVALGTPGTWELLAELPADLGGRAIQGWAEMAVVANDAAADADDRLYLLAGRIQVESSPGSGTYGKEENAEVLMFEAPTSAVGPGIWYRKSDLTPFTPRRFPAAGMINGRIYLLGGTGMAGTLDTVEMYEPDPAGSNAAVNVLGSSNYPTLVEPVYYSAAAVNNGSLYVLNGWKFQGYSPVATSRLQAFTPNAGGTGGTISQLAQPDNGSGYHSAVFHDGHLWFITGRDSFVQTPHYSVRYTP